MHIWIEILSIFFFFFFLKNMIELFITSNGPNKYGGWRVTKISNLNFFQHFQLTCLGNTQASTLLNIMEDSNFKI
jgi:hypothetical protein